MTDSYGHPPQSQRSSPAKNRMREFRTSGSVRGEGGNILAYSAVARQAEALRLSCLRAGQLTLMETWLRNGAIKRLPPTALIAIAIVILIMSEGEEVHEITDGRAIFRHISVLAVDDRVRQMVAATMRYLR